MSPIERDHAGEDGRHRHQVRVAVPDVRDLVREHGLELALGHRAQEAGRHADVARLRPQSGGERVRRGVVDDAKLRRHREPGADRHVLDEPAERAELVRATGCACVMPEIRLRERTIPKTP